MSCWVQPAGIDAAGVAAAAAVAAAVAAADVAAALAAAAAGVPDASAATGLAGRVVQLACEPEAQAAAMPATTTPPPATAAPRRRLRRERALSSGLAADSDGLTTGVTVSMVAMEAMLRTVRRAGNDLGRMIRGRRSAQLGRTGS